MRATLFALDQDLIEAEAAAKRPGKPRQFKAARPPDPSLSLGMTEGGVPGQQRGGGANTKEKGREDRGEGARGSSWTAATTKRKLRDEAQAATTKGKQPRRRASRRDHRRQVVAQAHPPASVIPSESEGSGWGAALSPLAATRAFYGGSRSCQAGLPASMRATLFALDQDLIEAEAAAKRPGRPRQFKAARPPDPSLSLGMTEGGVPGKQRKRGARTEERGREDRGEGARGPSWTQPRRNASRRDEAQAATTKGKQVATKGKPSRPPAPGRRQAHPPASVIPSESEGSGWGAVLSPLVATRAFYGGSRSCQAGLPASMRATFFARDQDLICFSRAMASIVRSQTST